MITIDIGPIELPTLSDDQSATIRADIAKLRITANRLRFERVGAMRGSMARPDSGVAKYSPSPYSWEVLDQWGRRK